MSHSCCGTPYCGNSSATVEPSVTLSRHNLYVSAALMRLIPLAGDEFLPKCQHGGHIIEGNKLISGLQDVCLMLLTHQSSGPKRKRAAVELSESFISLGVHSYFIRQFNTINLLCFRRCLMFSSNSSTQSELEVIQPCCTVRFQNNKV